MNFDCTFGLIGIPDRSTDIHYSMFRGSKLQDSHVIQTLPKVATHIDLQVLDDGDSRTIFTWSRFKNGDDAIIAHHIEHQPTCIHIGDIQHLIVGPSWIGAQVLEDETFVKWDIEGNQIDTIPLYSDGRKRIELGQKYYRYSPVNCFVIWNEDLLYANGNRLYVVKQDEEWAREPVGWIEDCGEVLKMVPFGDVLTVIFKTRPYYPRSTSGRDTAHYGYRRFGVLEKITTGGRYEITEQERTGTGKGDGFKIFSAPEDMAVSPCGKYFYEADYDGIGRRMLEDNFLSIKPGCCKNLKGLSQDQRVKKIFPIADMIVVLIEDMERGLDQYRRKNRIRPYLISAKFETGRHDETPASIELENKYKSMIVLTGVGAT
ncbi:hypothetical protein [Desulfatibacillum aliphaticivorans]|uniref:hypothetical protein n=1 Tax=Desulfatibacillum aliphaticivorans TaxID=218208 RepID=UPI0003FB3D1F|nr:hypothetical protein [Desulfatibacillum aliphaticivorans]